ncbi:MAG: hypothetical protein ACW981_07935 [Candidatus Hodarchaeales archaeon]|jgi:hypothetical protein
MNESEYFQGVVDCCKLLFKEKVGLSDTESLDKTIISEQIYTQLEKIEIELENRVPRISPLYTALKINKEAIESQSSYWEGVRDTTSLVRNFTTYKNNKYSLQEYEDFLHQILVKSSQKLESETSPLANKLDINFTNELPDETSFEVESKSNNDNSKELKYDRNEGLDLFSDDFSDDESKVEVNSTELLDQEEKIEEDSEEMIELALEELNRDNTISNLRSGLLSQINNEISRIDTPIEDTLSKKEKTVPIVRISPSDPDKSNREDELYSSPLKDALKMLKSDEDDELDS